MQLFVYGLPHFLKLLGVLSLHSAHFFLHDAAELLLLGAILLPHGGKLLVKLRETVGNHGVQLAHALCHQLGDVLLHIRETVVLHGEQTILGLEKLH